MAAEVSSSRPSSAVDGEEGQAFVAPAPRRPTVRQKTLRPAACEDGAEWMRFRDHRRERAKDDQVLALVKAAIEDVRVCARLPQADVQQIVENMQYFVFESDFVIQRQGEACELFIVVEEGSLEVHLDDQLRETVTVGGTFGAEGLLYGCPRTTVVRTKETTGIWGASGQTFQQVLRERARANCSDYRQCLASIPLFAGLPARQMDLLSQALFEEVYEPGAQVVKKGDDTQTLYCVRSGTLHVVESPAAEGPPQELMHYNPGDSFGERALLYGERRAATVLAVTRCELLCIGASQLGSVLGTDLHAYLERSVVLCGLRGSPAFSQFTSAQQCALTHTMEMKDCEPNTAIRPLLGDVRALVVVAGQIEDSAANDVEPVVIARGECCEVDSAGRATVGQDGGSPVLAAPWRVEAARHHWHCEGRELRCRLRRRKDLRADTGWSRSCPGPKGSCRISRAGS